MKPITRLAAALGLVLATGTTAFAAEQTVTLEVQNVSCVTCAPMVRRTLTRVPGVSRVARRRTLRDCHCDGDLRHGQDRHRGPWCRRRPTLGSRRGRCSRAAHEAAGGPMDIIERTIGAVGHAFALRPGVVIPDWTLVTEADGARGARRQQWFRREGRRSGRASTRPRTGSGGRSCTASPVPARRRTRRGWLPGPAWTSLQS